MLYPPSFLQIRVTFARRMAELSGQAVHESVVRNTTLYRILGLDWSLDAHDPGSQRFIGALGDGEGGIPAASAVYAERAAHGLIPEYDTSQPHWGCFSYEYLPEERVVRLHFVNLDGTGAGP